MTKTTLGARIRQARDAAGLTQEQLATLMGRDQQWIHKVESGKIKRLTTEVIMEIAGHTNSSPSWLALGIEELDKASEEAMTVAIHYDHLPVEIRNKVLTLIAEYRRPDYQAASDR
jgi:transcriptional regulator with XRE-family HTH domain